MTPERWEQIKSVFAVAVTLDPETRARYLDTACTDDPELRREVDSLLEANPTEGEFLDTPVVRLRPASPAEPSQLTGRRIGPYELLEPLGQGGMGEVYRARRADGQYEHQVAIKLIRSGHEGRALLQRFWTERQILATLDHPYIARLLDGGAADDGMPYLVMELIEGANICEYCDAHRLNITGRLELFRQVCSAVQYAHQRLIVHRDIKPTNILVTSDGTPKLLDFGIAKILTPSPDTEQTHSRPMTLAYASPEQIRGETVTTASDVYSLGVVLYRLLSGRSPYRVNATAPGGLYRAIEEDEPARPSTAIARPLGDEDRGIERKLTTEDVSARRDSSVTKLAKQLRGDLDDIVLKALRKEPDRRYASVDQLSGDIERHVNGFPVSARQGTWKYHAEKFVRRHRAAMAVAATLALVTAAGIAATLVEARIAKVNARRAEQRFEQVRKLARAMVFDVHDAIVPLPGATKPRELIVRLGLEYLDELSRDPTADASLLLQAADGYVKLGQAQGEPGQPNLGDQAGARASYRKAIGILDQLHAREPANRDVTQHLAGALNRMTRLSTSSAERWTFENRSLQLRQADAAAHPNDLVAQRNLAITLFDVGRNYLTDHRYAEAVAPFQRALATFQEVDRRAPTDDTARNVALCDKRLAAVSLFQNDYEAALRGYLAARAIDEKRVAQNPQNHEALADLAYDLSDLGTTFQRLERYTEAGDAYDRVIALRRDAYHADPNDARARVALASILLRRGDLTFSWLRKPRAAIQPLREASQLFSLGADRIDPERGQAENQLGWVYHELGDLREADAHWAAALAIFTAAAKADLLLAPNQQQMFDALRKRSSATQFVGGGKFD